MTLYLVGLGLADEKSITLEGLEIIKKCNIIYFETYTSLLQCSIADMEKLYGKKIIPANRELVECKAEQTILKDAKTKDVALLVAGDPLCATTHIDLMLRAKALSIDVKVINNTSVISAVGITGLEVYKFGRITSIPFDNKNVKTPIEVLNANQKIGLHTLFLLDLNPEKNRFMTINEAVEYLLANKVKEDMLAVGCARLGTPNPTIKVRKLKELAKEDFGKPPYCLIIPAKLHFMEEEALKIYS